MIAQKYTDYSLLSLLPESVGRHHQDLRRKIEQQFHLGGPIEFPVPSHVTMKYRFPVSNMIELEGAIQEFCTSQVKTEWTLHGFDYFANSDQFVIFINVIPSVKTREAHARLLGYLQKITWVQWGPFDHANLNYHVTLASKGLTAENFLSVWSFVNQQPYPKFDLFFDNLALLEIADDYPKIIKKYLLLEEA